MGANRQVEVEFTKSATPGLRDVVIRVKALKVCMVHKSGASRYYALNHNEMLDVTFNCDGTDIRARLVLKLVCQLKGDKLRKHRIERAMRRIAKKQPVVIDLY